MMDNDTDSDTDSDRVMDSDTDSDIVGISERDNDKVTKHKGSKRTAGRPDGRTNITETVLHLLKVC